jgi:hypothetical protein
MEAVAAGRLDEAEALFKQVLEKAPDLAARTTTSATSTHAHEGLAGAEAEFKRRSSCSPTAATLHGARRRLPGTDRRTQASSCCRRSSKFRAGRRRSSYDAGIAYLNSARTPRREAALREGARARPSRSRPLLPRNARRGAGKVDEAVAPPHDLPVATGQNPQNLETASRLLEAIKKPQVLAVARRAGGASVAAGASRRVTVKGSRRHSCRPEISSRTVITSS